MIQATKRDLIVSSMSRGGQPIVSTCLTWPQSSEQDRSNVNQANQGENFLQQTQLRNSHCQPSESLGVESKQLTLLKHPIEHLKRKFLASCLLAIAFKLVALLTGPAVVGLVYLLLVLPITLLRRLIESTFTCLIRGNNLGLPLTYLESYWFRSGLVSQLVLKVELDKDNGAGYGAGKTFSLANLRTLILDRIISQEKYTKFTCRVHSVLGSNYWKPVKLINQDDSRTQAEMADTDSWPISAHIFEDLDFSARVLSCDKRFSVALRRHLFALSSEPLDLRKPLWQIRAIRRRKKDNTVDENKLYLVLRCHQSLIDGSALAKMLTECLAEPSSAPSSYNHSSEQQQQQQEASDESEEPSWCELDVGESFAQKVGKLNSLISAIIVGPLTVLLWLVWSFTRRRQSQLRSQDSSKADLRPNSEEEFTQIDFGSYELTKLNQIKQMTRSKVGDVILCALSGALRNYLRHVDGVTNPPDLSAALAVDLGSTSCSSPHSQAATSDLDEHESSATLSESRLTLVKLPLPVDVEGTVPRLWRVRELMDELRHSADVWVLLGLQRILFALLPVACYQKLLDLVALRRASILVCCSRGPKNVVKFWCANLFQRAMFEAQQASAFSIDPRESTEVFERKLRHQLSDEPTRCAVAQRASLNSIGIGESGHELEKKLREQLERPVGLDDHLDDVGDMKIDKIIASEREREQVEAKRRRVRLRNHLGTIDAIYQTFEAPSGDIPLAFGCLTYHNRLFVSVVSRCKQVRDARHLLRLFFEQLDQLADGIGKRRSFVAIVATPRRPDSEQVSVAGVAETSQPTEPIEAPSEQPIDSISKPTAGEQQQLPVELGDAIEVIRREQRKSLRFVTEAKSALELMVNKHERRQFRDDIETRIGADSGSRDKCQSCRQVACTCRRRKSLFTLDTARQPLLASLLPGIGQFAAQSVAQASLSAFPAIGRRRADEIAELELKVERQHQAGSLRNTNEISTRSSSSLMGCGQVACQSSSYENFQVGMSARHGPPLWLEVPNRSAYTGREPLAASADVLAPEPNLIKRNSKSESELAPKNIGRDDKHKQNKPQQHHLNRRDRPVRQSWFVRMRQSHRKLLGLSLDLNTNDENEHDNSSTLTTSVGQHCNSQGSMARPASGVNSDGFSSQVPAVAQQQHSSVEANKRRRQSVATITGLSSSSGANNFQRSAHKVIVLNDEADNEPTEGGASAKGHYANAPGRRSRRSSITGSVLGANQRRRASLMVPSGFMLNQNLPRPPAYLDDDDDDDDNDDNLNDNDDDNTSWHENGD